MSLPPAAPRRTDGLTAAVLAAGGILAALTVIRTAAHIAYPYPLDNGEGTVLSAMWRLACGENFYGVVSRPPYVFTVYNPLAVLLGGAAMRFIEAVPTWPRIEGAAFLFGSAALLYAFVRRETGLARAGLIAAFFFLAERHVYSRAGYAVVDFPGIFFSLAGLYLWRAGGRARWVALASFAFAFFSKQSSLSAAGACFLALFLEGRRARAAGLFAAFLAMVAAGLALSVAVFGQAYLVDAFSYVRTAPISLYRSISHATVAVGLCAPLFAAAVYMAARALRDRELRLPACYFTLAFVMSFASGKIGASRSYFFDYAAALAVVAGLAWARVVARTLAGKRGIFVTAAVICQLFLVGLGIFHGLSPTGERTPGDRTHDAAVKEAYMTGGGIVLSRDQGFDVGTPSVNLGTDLYQLTTMTKMGRFSKDLMLDPVRDKSLAVIIMPERELTWKMFTPALRTAVLENYTPVRKVGGSVFYVPETPVGDGG